MAHQHTVTTYQSWGARLKDSFKSVLVGVALALGAFPLMWCNEGRAVRTARSLEEGAGLVISVPSVHVDAANEGKLVHTSGRADTGETVRDATFGLSAPAIKIIRTVEMYQWDEDEKTETKEKLGGGKETKTTYEYRKTWSARAINSSTFRNSSYKNPGEFPWPSLTTAAPRVTLGAFVLSPDQVEQIERAEPLPVDEWSAGALPASVGVRPVAGRYYRGKNPDAPEIGDLRISFQVVKPQDVSVIARQHGSTFEPYSTKAGNALLLLDNGLVSADTMFKAAEHDNRVLTWILRGVGALLLFIGLLLVFRPIATMGAVVPLVGNVLGAGIGVFSLLVALVLSLLTVAVAWMFYRPLLSVGLLSAAAIAVFLLRSRAAKGR